MNQKYSNIRAKAEGLWQGRLIGKFCETLPPFKYGYLVHFRQLWDQKPSINVLVDFMFVFSYDLYFLQKYLFDHGGSKCSKMSKYGLGHHWMFWMLFLSPLLFLSDLNFSIEIDNVDFLPGTSQWQKAQLVKNEPRITSLISNPLINFWGQQRHLALRVQSKDTI